MCSFHVHVCPPPVLYTLSLHDALPILALLQTLEKRENAAGLAGYFRSTPHPSSAAADHVVLTWSGDPATTQSIQWRSEEHTSELQSRENLVCRLLLEKKKNNTTTRQRQ